MNNLILPQSESLTMSSREIAELVNSRHADLMRSIDRLSLKEVINKYTPVAYTNESNNQRYFEYLISKRDTYIIVAQNSPEFTAVLVDRWQELENKQAPVLPTPTQLALMVIEAEKQKELALIEVDRIQGICQTITAQFKTGMTPAKFAKQFNGVNSQQVNKTLIELNKLRVDGKGYSPTSVARDDLFKANYGDFAPYPTLLLKGAKWMYKAYLSGKLPMKKTWDQKVTHMIFEG